jgi:hypothetical protein
MAYAVEEDWGGEAHDGDVADAVAVDPFGSGSMPAFANGWVCAYA